ncbi:MAG: 2-C-methyl-D-erythritol 4-phosphate cytidylyltransferase [Clostridium sp.]|nr:2-C-methyl-D-erythritol 4-phosphate cytidylyltransferase [Clostridium sp.]
MNIALIIAGGAGERMKQSIPKQFLEVFHKPVIAYTMEAFQNCEEINDIIVVSLAGWETAIWKYAKEYGITKLKKVVVGGDCGQKSIYNGIAEIQKSYNGNDIVLIHDAIRPMVSTEIIEDCISGVKKNGNAITVIPCQEAMLETQNKESAISSYPREQLMRTQTPQGFYLKEIIALHNEAREKNITNSIATCTLAVALGRTLFFSKGSEKNLKITTMDDLDIFKALLQVEKNSNFN